MKTWTAELTCVGLQFRWTKDNGRPALKKACPFPVALKREPDNEHDENAIMVLIDGDRKLTKLKGKQLGYLRKNIAALLAPKIDAGTLEAVKLWVIDVDVDSGEATIDARFRDVTPKRAAAKRKNGKRAGTARKRGKVKRFPGAP
jgi:hypothetical protein